MPDRKAQILSKAIEIIANEGYGQLSMRALARASGLKLGALQYHYPTWEKMLHALADHILEAYRQDFDAVKTNTAQHDIITLIEFLCDDLPSETLDVEGLWPQLWAMGRVEPVMGQLLNDVAAQYLSVFEGHLKELGSKDPHAEALILMSLIEGSELFVGRGSRWAKDAGAVKKQIVDLVTYKYGNKGAAHDQQ